MALGVPEFRRALIRLGGALDGDIGKLVAAIGGLDVPAAMRLVTEAYPELASPYLALAADLTATWYEEQPTAAGAKPFTAQPADLPAVEQLAANARWALTQTNPTTALQRSGQRQFFQQHRDTVLLNVEREGVGWAREARPGACGFCRVMATRVLTMGFGGAPGLYRSELTAGASAHRKDAEGHDGCRCIGVPIRGGEPYTVPGYVHDWLDDYEAVSRDESGRLLPLSKIAAAMEQRGAMRGEPSEATAGDSAPVIVDLDAAGTPTQPASAPPPKTPTSPPAPESEVTRFLRELMQARPMAIEGPRQLLALTAAPDRPAVTPPDPRAIADWLDAEDDHRHALEYWRRVDEENLHSLPAEQAIPEEPPAPLGPLAARVAELEAKLEAAASDTRGTRKQQTQRRDAIRIELKQARRAQEEARAAGIADEPVELVTPDTDPVGDVHADEHAGETELDRAVREFEEALASGDDARIDAAAEAMERAEQAERVAAEQAAERAAKRAARAEANAEAEQERMLAAIEAGEDPAQAEADILIERPSQRRKIRDLVATGDYDDDEARTAVRAQILERIYRRDFMAQARADGHRGKGFDDLLDSVFQRRADELYYEAEAATRGQMVKRQYATRFDPKRFWYCNDTTARKYMSDELAEWFDQNGRLTRPIMRQMILDGSTNFTSYTAMRADYLE